MRPAALLTGLTGIVAVLVLVYVGLTAMNLEPHITFGDPNRVVANANIGEVTKPVAAPSAPASAVSNSVPAPAPSADKPVMPSAQTEVPAPAATQSAAAAPAATATPPVVAMTAPSKETAQAPVVPPETTPAPPPALTVEEAAKPSAPPAGDAVSKAPPVSTPSAPAVPKVSAPVAADTEPAIAPPIEITAPSSPPPVAAETKPVEEAKSEDHAASPASSLPLLPTIPTPLARPEPPAEAQAKAIPVPEKPPEPAPPAKVEPPVEEASLPPTEAEAAKKPETSADTQVAKLEPGTDLKSVDLSRPLAERAGVLTIGNKVVQLAGIMPTDPARSCTGPNGKEWPCGTLARTALRAFLLGRTITCDVPDPQWKGPVTAECRFAKVSLGDWLARNGWAEPAAGSPLMSVAEEARKDGRGIYGNDPRKEHKSTLAPAPPAEDPLNPI